MPAARGVGAGRAAAPGGQWGMARGLLAGKGRMGRRLQCEPASQPSAGFLDGKRMSWFVVRVQLCASSYLLYLHGNKDMDFELRCSV